MSGEYYWNMQIGTMPNIKKEDEIEFMKALSLFIAQFGDCFFELKISKNYPEVVDYE